jgi:hypothetical protein
MIPGASRPGIQRLALMVLPFAVACGDPEAGIESPESSDSAISLAREGGYATLGGVERLDPRLDSLIPSDAEIEVLAQGFDWSEGPVWIPEGEFLLFSDVPTNRVYRWKEGEGHRVWLERRVTPARCLGVVSPDPTVCCSMPSDGSCFASKATAVSLGSRHPWTPLNRPSRRLPTVIRVSDSTVRMIWCCTAAAPSTSPILPTAWPQDRKIRIGIWTSRVCSGSTRTAPSRC